MNRIFIIIAFLLSLCSFNSNANTISKDDTYACKDYVSGETLGYASSYENCKDYAEQATYYPRCTGPSFYQSYIGHSIRCSQGLVKPYLIRIFRTQLDSCPASHAIDNGDGTCSFGEAPPPPPPPTCPEEGTFYKALYGPTSFNNRKSCFPNNCAIAFQTESSAYVETQSDGVWKTSLELFYTGESCSYDADNTNVVEMSHVFVVPDNVHPTGDAPPENYEPSYQHGSIAGFMPLAPNATIRSENFTAFVRFIESNDKTELLSQPELTIMHGKEGLISVGQELPFITVSFTTEGDSSDKPFQTIERKDVGLSLYVMPYIGADGTIQLKIRQELSRVDKSIEASDIVTSKRQLDNTLSVRSGQTIALGGMTSTDSQMVNVKVPILGDIPFLGLLFSSESEKTTKRTLSVVLYIEHV